MTDRDLTPAEVVEALNEISASIAYPSSHITACVGTWNRNACFILSGRRGNKTISAETWREAVDRLREWAIGQKDEAMAASRASMAGAILAELAKGKAAREPEEVAALGFDDEIVERDLAEALLIVKNTVKQAQLLGFA